MTEEQIRNAFQNYKHPVYGVVGLFPANGEDKDTFSTDNYHLFNALYWRILHSWGYFPTLKDNITPTIAFGIACEKQEGLYARFPTRMGDDISQDDLYGICYTSPGDAMAIAEYGSENYWCYNLANPGKFKINYFFARYPSFVAYVKACAGKPIWFSQFVWCVGFLCSALTEHGETTGKLLSYLQIPKMSEHFFPRLAIKLWKYIMTKRYPNGAREIMSIYFGTNSPFTTCAKEDWQG